MDKNFFGGLIVGVAVGFIFSLLSTPEEGAVLRKKIINKIENQINKISLSTKNFIDLINDTDRNKILIEDEIH